LNRFEISIRNNRYVVDSTSETVTGKSWTLQYPDFLPFHIVALMHRPTT
jgi:hypothetical protein